MRPFRHWSRWKVWEWHNWNMLSLLTGATVSVKWLAVWNEKFMRWNHSPVERSHEVLPPKEPTHLETEELKKLSWYLPRQVIYQREQAWFPQKRAAGICTNEKGGLLTEWGRAADWRRSLGGGGELAAKNCPNAGLTKSRRNTNLVSKTTIGMFAIGLREVLFVSVATFFYTRAGENIIGLDLCHMILLYICKTSFTWSSGTANSSGISLIPFLEMASSSSILITSCARPSSPCDKKSLWSTTVQY